MITNLSAIPPNPYTLKIKKGAVITATFEQHVGGVIKIMFFPSAEITRKEYINTPHYQGTIHAVFTHREAIIKDKPPSDSHSLSQYIPFGFDRLNKHKIAGGRFLITKDITPNNETRIYDDNAMYLTSIIEGDDNTIRNGLKTALIKTYLPAIGVFCKDTVWTTAKIIMETIEPAILALPEEKADLGILFGPDSTPVIEVYPDNSIIRARLESEHTIHSVGVDEADAIKDLMLTLKNMGRTHDPKDYLIKRIGIEEPGNSVAALFKEHEIMNNQCAIGKKFEDYIKNKFEDADKIEIDIPNVKITETDDEGTFEYNYTITAIMDNRRKIW